MHRLRTRDKSRFPHTIVAIHHIPEASVTITQIASTHATIFFTLRTTIRNILFLTSVQAFAIASSRSRITL